MNTNIRDRRLTLLQSYLSAKSFLIKPSPDHGYTQNTFQRLKHNPSLIIIKNGDQGNTSSEQSEFQKNRYRHHARHCFLSDDEQIR